MPLAAALAADGVRSSGFLPGVKCSDCGIELQIEEMGEHVCGAPVPLSKGHSSTMSNPFTLRRLNAGAQQTTSSPLQSQVFPPGPPQGPASKLPRITIPRISPDAANRPFLPPKSPLAAPSSPAVSIRTGISNAGKPKILRSMTSPGLFDFQPPSPEMSANLDCAFPPFPPVANNDRRPSTSHGRKTPTGSDRAPSRGASRLDHIRNAEPEPFSLEPQSPQSNGKENVLQRLDSMTSGPFDINRRKESMDSKFGFASPQKRRSSEPAIDGFPPRPSTANSNHFQMRRPSEPTWSDNAPDPSLPLPLQPFEEEGSPSFTPHFSAEPASITSPESAENIRPIDRNNTYPYERDDRAGTPTPQTLSRMRSEPSLRETGQRPLLVQPPPRSDSRNDARLDFRIRDAPPVPKAIQQYRQDSSHAPSESGSSITSGSNSAPHSAGSRLSPSSSVTSSADTFSALTFDSEKYVEDERMRVEGLAVKNQQRTGMRVDQLASRSPPRNFMRAAAPDGSAHKFEDVSPTPQESPMDPALLPVQHETAAQYEPMPMERFPFPPALSIPKLPNQPSIDDSLSRSAPPIERARSPSNATLPYSAIDPPWPRNASPTSLQPPPVPKTPQPRRQATRRGTNAKPMCRGCGLMIEGKSVKAADGRLTGRWHKACFVCRSCQQPFTTADFYVINNEPYCEQHYHEQNGSLCHGCNRGIEGQYLETSSSTRFGSLDKKFHPRCFTCFECRMVLAQDYFEIHQKVYCERHALAAMRAQARLGTGLNPVDRRGLTAERRTTKLINPILA